MPTRLAVCSRSALASRAPAKSSSFRADRNSNQRPRNPDRVVGGGRGETVPLGCSDSGGVPPPSGAIWAAAGNAAVSRNRTPAAALCIGSARRRRRRGPARLHVGHPQLVEGAGQEILFGEGEIAPCLSFEE